MNKDVKANYYSVVPAEVKYNNELTQKIFNIIIRLSKFQRFKRDI